MYYNREIKPRWFECLCERAEGYLIKQRLSAYFVILQSSLVMVFLYVVVLCTYLKHFVIGKDIDRKRSNSGNDTKIIVWLTSASITHVFKLNCYTQPSIGSVQGVKFKLEGCQVAQGVLNWEQ